jgi:light-regulated signal transduction histidine kinase (bacteriophytochrome)
VRDITEKKKTEHSLLQRAEELRLINKELEQFAYVASHDLQEPLRTVISYMQLIEKKYKNKLGEEGDEFIHYAVDGANRMHVLIKDLLTYSRLGTHLAPFEQVNVKEAIDIAMENLHKSITESNATIEIDEHLPEINGDGLQMTMLFQNLLANAIKFKNHEPPKIAINAVQNGTHWKFAITDNGIGIPNEYSQRVFVIFQRLHTRDKYPGTGIGLAICKKIVERHGGEIWIDSEVGKGSTFYFTVKK